MEAGPFDLNSNILTLNNQVILCIPEALKLSNSYPEARQVRIDSKVVLVSHTGMGTSNNSAYPTISYPLPWQHTFFLTPWAVDCSLVSKDKRLAAMLEEREITQSLNLLRNPLFEFLHDGRYDVT
ncbi:hypothetical protein AC249_AIPGENE16191 [Exaiptasia diaphana]|nr:hypothetical protein AC249_AIPGENE16191 [Exaiptasia diaphana]